MTTKFKILSAISFIALAVVLTFVGVWALTDLDFTVGGNIEYTAPAPEPVTPEEVSYLTFEYDDTSLTAKLTACSASAPEKVEIPAMINKSNKIYNVTSIAGGEYDNMEDAYQGLFYGTSVKEVVIPNTVIEIGEGAFGKMYGGSFDKVTIGNGVQTATNAFYSTRITEIIFVKGIKKIPNMLFGWGGACSALTIPEGVEEIGDMAFYSCQLGSVQLPEGLKIIGKDAFSLCSGLASITIPNSVTSIGKYAFSGCTSLVEVEVKATTVPTGASYMFDSCHADLEIKVPSASMSAYKSATYWKDYNIVDGGF